MTRRRRRCCCLPLLLPQVATFCNKVKTQAALGIVGPGCCCAALLFFAGEWAKRRWCGYHKLLDEFPAEFAALVDKGFTHCVGAYLHFLYAYYPAFVHGGEIGVQGVKDSKKQSYVVEVFYSRVKRWLMLRDRARWANIHILDDAWCIALAGTDHDQFLRAPNNAAAIQAAMRDLAVAMVAINKSTETERAAWPKDTEIPSYMQRPADLRSVN